MVSLPHAQISPGALAPKEIEHLRGSGGHMVVCDSVRVCVHHKLQASRAKHGGTCARLSAHFFAHLPQTAGHSFQKMDHSWTGGTHAHSHMHFPLLWFWGAGPVDAGELWASRVKTHRCFSGHKKEGD